MGLRATVKKEVKRAFSLIGDLKTSVIFTKNQNASFNFSSGTVVKEPVETLILQGVFVEKKTSSLNKTLESSYAGSLFFIADEAQGIESYDTLQFHNKTWKIVPPIKNDDYLIEVRVA